MNIQNFHMAIGKVVPKFNGKSSCSRRQSVRRNSRTSMSMSRRAPLIWIHWKGRVCVHIPPPTASGPRPVINLLRELGRITFTSLVLQRHHERHQFPARIGRQRPHLGLKNLKTHGEKLRLKMADGKR